MAASPKYKWFLKKYARFLHEDELNSVNDEDTETMPVSCKGTWKLYSGEKKDLILSYLESDHFLLTRQDIIMESFSLVCSKTWLKGVAKADSLLMLCEHQNGNVRRFRIQFDGQDEKEGTENRKQCTDMLKKFIKINDCDYENDKHFVGQETLDIDNAVFDKMKLRKGYAVNISKDNLQEIITLCMTDSSFPSYVEEIDKLLREIGNQVK